ncbi:ribbon-helix-helix protein, CopG family [Lawsonibacter celer]|jgi:predicted DNA-binding protein|uniref:ribbon-helix-helix protein, CopG family n=1 Tax=Lawsonibacter celer TaxID=2986526 RepID=UPI00164726F2|nr:ribbon-helix-helix protein, CopG family [Lawsonibacter celer]
MKPLKVKVSITLDEPTLERIRQLAEQDDRPLSSYINQVLKAHLEQLDQEKR